MRFLALALPILSTSVLVAAPACAADPAPAQVVFTLKNHRFTPDTATVPAGRKVVITLINQDGAAEEFDSSDLRVEEDVTPRASIRFSVGPLKPGTYRFMGEAHADTAEGRILAVPDA